MKTTKLHFSFKGLDHKDCGWMSINDILFDIHIVVVPCIRDFFSYCMQSDSVFLSTRCW